MPTTVIAIVHTASLLLQLIGALLVALDVRRALSSFSELQQSLKKAEKERDKHISHIKAEQERITNGSRYISQRFLSDEEAGKIADQMGPSSVLEQQAIRSFILSNHKKSKVTVWIGPILVTLGLVTGYVATIFSL